jgi:hypothetical protein
LIALLIYRMVRGYPKPRDDIDRTKRTVIVRRLKGSTDSSHYLERDEHKALGRTPSRLALTTLREKEAIGAGHCGEVALALLPSARLVSGRGKLFLCHHLVEFAVVE